MDSKHGFANLTKEEHAALSARGGKRAHALGKAHQWTSDSGRRAGKKGGAGNKKRFARKG